MVDLPTMPSADFLEAMRWDKERLLAWEGADSALRHHRDAFELVVEHPELRLLGRAAALSDLERRELWSLIWTSDDEARRLEGLVASLRQRPTLEATVARAWPSWAPDPEAPPPTFAGPVVPARHLLSQVMPLLVWAREAQWLAGEVRVEPLIAVHDTLIELGHRREASTSAWVLGLGAFLLAWRRVEAQGEASAGEDEAAAACLRSFLRSVISGRWVDAPAAPPHEQPACRTLLESFQAESLLSEAACSAHRRHFYTAWAVLRAGITRWPWRLPVSRPDHARAVREHLAWDFVGWRARHVFGNQLGHDSLPAMPLEQVYVEPLCDEGPIQAALWAWLEDRSTPPTIAVVQADFGHGKSLSARRFATDLAQAWLASGQPGEAWWPVFIRCASHYAAPDLVAMARRAQQEQLAAAGGPALPDDDEVLAPPHHSQQKVVFILDGLDEVHLDQGALAALFHHLAGKTADRQRVVVFSRPAAVGGLAQKESIRSFKLEPFSEEQIEDWLARWSALQAAWAAGERPLTLADLEERGLAELAVTPILLFMIAWTWQPEAPAERDEVGVYERFFLQLARSKSPYDGDSQHREGHKVVVEATAALHRRLIERKLLPDDTEAPEALLWLLGRVAWQHARHAHQDQPLLQRHVENVIEQELKLSTGPTFDLIQRGLMLVLPVDPGSAQPVVEFGHRSFREYLVARYWRARLTHPKFGDADERALLGARLMQEESKAFGFLVALIRHAGAAAQVAKRAEERFLDDHLGNLDGETSRPGEDLRLYLREAALALRCHLDETPFQPPASAVHSLFGLFQAQGVVARIDAPRLVLEKLNLFGFFLMLAQLQSANLSEADLRRTDLWEANLWGANLGGADLWEANLWGANLGGAYLGRANLEGANLRGVNLRRANLAGADLGGANLAGAYLGGANLRDANLGTGPQRVRGLRRAHHLEHAHMPDGFSLETWPEDDD